MTNFHLIGSFMLIGCQHIGHWELLWHLDCHMNQNTLKNTWNETICTSTIIVILVYIDWRLTWFNSYSTRTKHACIVIACILNRPYDVIFCITSMSEITYYIQFHLIFKETVAQIPRISYHNKLRTKSHAKNFPNKTMILGRMAQTQ